jgi:hypothetical protein
VIVSWRPGPTEDQVLEHAGTPARAERDGRGPAHHERTHRAESAHGFTHALRPAGDDAALARDRDHPARKRDLAEDLKPIEDQRIEINVGGTLALEPEPLASWYLA